MKYVLYGPPGVGKSTLVKALGGIDLESFPRSRRVEILKTGVAKYFGSADVNPHVYDADDVCWVFLSMPNKEYESRRAARDLISPGKATQPHITLVGEKLDHVKWLDGAQNAVTVDASGLIPEVCKRIRNCEWLETVHGF